MVLLIMPSPVTRDENMDRSALDRCGYLTQSIGLLPAAHETGYHHSLEGIPYAIDQVSAEALYA